MMERYSYRTLDFYMLAGSQPNLNLILRRYLIIVNEHDTDLWKVK